MTKERTSKQRSAYIDNLRIFLTSIVILHHASLAYGGAGDWAVRDPSTDTIGQYLFPFFNVVNQSYFMSAFFLLAGYFTPKSYDGKGAFIFVKDRLIRLGTPLLIYVAIIRQANHFLIQTFQMGGSFEYSLHFNAGHLWFLQALLVFAGIYVIYRVATESFKNRVASTELSDDETHLKKKFPTHCTIALAILILAGATFVVRLFCPVGTWMANFQLGHFVHYAFCFYAGIAAYRNDWFSKITPQRAKPWKIVTVTTIPTIGLISYLGGMMDNPEDYLKASQGAWDWRALAYSTWETIMMFGAIITLLSIFRMRFDGSSSVSRFIAPNVYTVYILHQTALYAAQIGLLPIQMPTLPKFIVASIATGIACLIVSSILRQSTTLRRVLG